ncbi:MAG: acetylglutamate kinase, partial [Actinomycetota bacterium]
AGALRATQTLFMTDVSGIYSRWPDQSSMIDEITVAQLKELTFADGMVPKVEAATNAITLGAASSRIFNGTSLPAFVDALEGKGGTWVRA